MVHLRRTTYRGGPRRGGASGPPSNFLFISCIVLIVFVTSTIWTIGIPIKFMEPPFWKHTVIYQVYPRSFSDGDMDGTGDLKGITSKVDYLKDLGIGAVWMSPIYASPMADFGYDISNFTHIDPTFGSMDDFEELLDTFHQRGLKVLMDFVPNHSSDEHQWFAKSVKREDPYTAYYVWGDPRGFNDTGHPIPPNNWLSSFRGPAWTWVEERQQFYYHKYLSKQPDLNYRNPYVKAEMSSVIQFWLDKGVDGLRVDALSHLFEVEDIYQDEPVAELEVKDPMAYHHLNHTLTVNQPENYMMLKEWRKLIDLYPDRCLMVEVKGSTDEVMAYYGNETIPLADFPFNFQMITKIRKRSDLTGESLKAMTSHWLDNMPAKKWANWLLGSHDNSRVSSRLGEDMVDAFHMLTLLLPGTPVTYYGEEIGMVDTWLSWEDTQDPSGCRYGPKHYTEKSRDPGRTPMQWNNATFAGFTEFNNTWLPVNENYPTLNVASQTEAEVSHLNVYKALTKLRKEPGFRRDKVEYPVITADVFSFIRKSFSDERYLVVINTSERKITVNLHNHSMIELPKTAFVVLRSITDTSEETIPRSEVSLDNLKMEGGEGLVLCIPDQSFFSVSVFWIVITVALSLYLLLYLRYSWYLFGMDNKTKKQAQKVKDEIKTKQSRIGLRVFSHFTNKQT